MDYSSMSVGGTLRYFRPVGTTSSSTILVQTLPDIAGTLCEKVPAKLYVIPVVEFRQCLTVCYIYKQATT